jgi:CheY-like chemotaxis protein
VRRRLQRSGAARSGKERVPSIQRGSIILVMVDDHEIRDGMETLLEADGYGVQPARNEKDAVTAALQAPPDLILVSFDQSRADAAVSARCVRIRAGLRESTPIVVFSIADVAEGAELAIGQSTYVTSPADFNQLRTFLGRLLATNGMTSVLPREQATH